MLLFWKLILIGLIALTLIYWLVSAFCRWLHREALEKRWDAEAAKDPAARDAAIDADMARYKTRLRRKLLGLVYVLPICVLTVLIVAINMQ